MKVYVSVDIEGVACIAAPAEADAERAESAPFREQMTAEAAAACDGAFSAGATGIVLLESLRIDDVLTFIRFAET